MATSPKKQLSEDFLAAPSLYGGFNRPPLGLIILLVIGGIIGWLASIVMRTDGQQGLFLNVVVGIVGALLAGLLLNPLLGGSNIVNGDYTISALLVSFLGAVVLLAIVNFFRRGAVR